MATKLTSNGKASSAEPDKESKATKSPPRKSPSKVSVANKTSKNSPSATIKVKPTGSRPAAEPAQEFHSDQRAIINVIEKLSEATDVRQAASIALQSIRESFGWAYGAFWEHDKKTNSLVYAADCGTAASDFRRVTAETSFGEGVGLVGRAWRNRDLTFVEDLGKVSDCPRAPLAARGGIAAGVCFPLFVAGRIYGALDFLAGPKMNMSQDHLDALRAIGRLVSKVVGDLEEKSQAKFMVENAPINMMTCDLDLVVTYMNPSSLKTLTTLEQHLPVRANQILGRSIDIFHKNPEHQRRMLADPSNLPHQAKISIGPEKLNLLVSAIRDDRDRYVGTLLTWEVITVTEALKAAVQEKSVTLGEASANLRDVATNMAAAAEQSSTQAVAASKAGEVVNHNINSVASATEEMACSIREISKNAGQAAQVAGNAVLVANSTNETILKLGESSVEIGNVIKVITSIAQQSNLLALNATIEAARAGEAGRGFAVVANEVKELAKGTARATEDISLKIQTIQEDSRGAVAAIAEIGKIISDISDIANSIAGAVEEQSATTTEISRNVSDAARGSNEITAALNQVAEAADKGTQGASDTLNSSRSLTGLAEDLRELLTRFQG